MSVETSKPNTQITTPVDTAQSVRDKSWGEAIQAFWDKRVMAMILLGFSAGIPILLIFSSLSLWLGEAGVAKKTVTFFSWAALGYSFKFIWAPLVDVLPIPMLTKRMGMRRSWLLLAQTMVIVAICLMAMTDPVASHDSLVILALGAVLLGFSSATQDIVIDAYRIEIGNVDIQTVLSSAYTMGYRLAMIVSGAGALWLASGFGTEKGHYIYAAWQQTYLIMAVVMLVGVATTFMIQEPAASEQRHHYAAKDYIRLFAVFISVVMVLVFTYVGLGNVWQLPEKSGPLLSFISEALRLISSIAVAGVVGFNLVKIGMVNPQIAHTTWVKPIQDFFTRFGFKAALTILLFIGFYRISDIVAGVISNVFYQDMGFNKEEIATGVKTVGVIVSIAGGFFGGLLTQKYSIYKVLLLGAVASSLSHLTCVGLANAGHDFTWFYTAIFVDNFATGIATAAFIAFLSGLTNKSFTAVQYAIFSSIMTLFPKLIGGYSGSIVENIGYPNFFIMTTLIGIPMVFMVFLVKRVLEQHTAK